mmetsp:Transcript_61964/g.135707  ORF Transcript_61964/g.135707 Transcript_61964/m.135707 type:complete len:209 (+) Transcript_61964:65-691(+)
MCLQAQGLSCLGILRQGICSTKREAHTPSGLRQRVRSRLPRSRLDVLCEELEPCAAGSLLLDEGRAVTMFSCPVLPFVGLLGSVTDLLQLQGPFFKAFIFAVFFQLHLCSVDLPLRRAVLLHEQRSCRQILHLDQARRWLMATLGLQLLYQASCGGWEVVCGVLHRKQILETAQHVLHPLQVDQHGVDAKLIGRLLGKLTVFIFGSLT